MSNLPPHLQKLVEPLQKLMDEGKFPVSNFEDVTPEGYGPEPKPEPEPENQEYAGKAFIFAEQMVESGEWSSEEGQDFINDALSSKEAQS